MEINPSQQNNTHEKIPLPAIEIEPNFIDFVPQEFLNDPLGYFEREGINIKRGEIKYNGNGVIREDPTMVKDLPTWKNADGSEIKTVGKRVNKTKGVVGESGDPFYEYKILEKLAYMGLPAAKPVAKIKLENAHIIIMEQIPGIRWPERDILNLKGEGYSDADIADLMKQADQKMNELKDQFDKAGVIRNWKLKDMVFQIDVKNKIITSMVPTDWERTKITKET